MTNQEKNLDTKKKIIQAANELFAIEGYAGTSVRDIASKADVNLSAINYHFNNKENLYWQVFDYNYNWISETITEFGKEASNTEDLAAMTYHFFAKNEQAMMNTFKLFLSNLTPPDNTLTIDKNQSFGPPGQEVFFQKIQGDLKMDLPIDAMMWGTKMIFSLLFYLGVMINTKMMKKRCQTEEHLRPEKMEEALRHSVRAHLDYIKNHHQIWT